MLCRGLSLVKYKQFAQSITIVMDTGKLTELIVTNYPLEMNSQLRLLESRAPFLSHTVSM
jgi:hypothetical protein